MSTRYLFEDVSEDFKLELYKQLNETQRTLIQTVISLGINALRGIFLLNGGGAVASLSHINTLQHTFNTNSAYYFAIGALCAVIASGTAYASQLFAAWHFSDAANFIISTNPDKQQFKCAYGVICNILIIISALLFATSCGLFVQQIFSITAAFKAS